MISVATVIVYSNTLGASFHLDDFDSIVRNPSLQSLSHQWPPSGNRWLGTLTFALNYRFGGLEVWGYHAVNILIHVCNGMLVAWLAALTMRTPALRDADAGPLLRRYLPLTAGLLFAVHPVATQAVTYVVQRFASLATLFYLLSLALYARARLSLERGRGWNARAAGLYCLSVVAAAAAMKTKEISFTLPLVAAGYDLLLLRSGRRLLLVAPIAGMALLIPFGLVTPGQDVATALGDPSHLAAETPNISRVVYLLTQSRVLVTYLRLLVWPVRQNLDYDYPLSISLSDSDVLFSLAVLVALAGLAAFLLRRARRTNRAVGTLIFFGVAWFFMTSLVESSIIPIRDVIFEHRLYLPAAGAAIALGTMLLSALERLHSSASPTLQVAAALVVTAGPLGVAAHARNSVWKDEVTLWRDVVAKSPAKPRPHRALSEAYRASGRTYDAMREYREAMRLEHGKAETQFVSAGAPTGNSAQTEDMEQAVRVDPRNAQAHIHLGDTYRASGRLEDAVREYREAIRLDPRSVAAHGNLGSAYRAMGQLDDAIREYREALQLVPQEDQSAALHSNLGNVYKAKGQIDDALHEYQEAVRLAPGSPHFRNNLGFGYSGQGRLDDAIREYLEAIRLSPSLPDTHINLGIAYGAKGQFDDAIREYQEALRLSPASPEAHNDLGFAYSAKGRLDDAIREYQEAIRLSPDYAAPHHNLVTAYRQKGQFGDAEREHQEATRLDTANAKAR